MRLGPLHVSTPRPSNLLRRHGVSHVRLSLHDIDASAASAFEGLVKRGEDERPEGQR